ncbi:MAG TPA: glycoside hydrolase family 2 protein [Rhodanobacteraceae bacterium]
MAPLQAQVVRQTLDQGWQLRLAPHAQAVAIHPRAAQWLTAHVPGTVQTDLLAAGLVKRPYYRDNEPTLQWVGMSAWEYRTTFEVDAATLQRAHVDLVFKGLDTFADVTLNGHHVLSADNMFRRWRVPVKRWLRVGTNTLAVHLQSPITHMLPWVMKQPAVLPGEFPPRFGLVPGKIMTATYVRKAAYQYGWDWAPRFVTEGIWKPVLLESWDTLRLADFHIAQPEVTAAMASLQALLDVRSDVRGRAIVRIDWTAPDGMHGQRIRTVAIKKGRDQLSVPIRIDHPQRWWPVGYGKPNLYRFHATVSMGGKTLVEASHDTGLRSVVLRRLKDRWGRSFGFVVNGVPIFAKGANFIPPDSFPPRVTRARMHHLLASARAAHMNMLRIWGGGYYLDDAFYAMADRMGIMLWQGFMFGGPMPPSTPTFVDNARQEAIQQVRRLRDHPSIVLWCGNNEVEDGWEHFGWQKALRSKLSAAAVEKIGQGMHVLFDKVLRKVVSVNEPAVPYIPTSPIHGGIENTGDYHYWSVWSGSAPIDTYLDVTPRFESEYGLQSMPDMATIDGFTLPADRTLDSKVMRAHQKFANGNGNQRLMLYIRRLYGEPKNFADTVYLSQVMQAEGIELNAEHLRAARPQSMGSLYWMLDDVWPGITWSSIDYDGRWKMLQYHARRFYAPVRIIPIRQHGVTRVSVVSDRRKPFAASVRIRVFDMRGELIDQQQRIVHMAALASTSVGQYDDAQLLHGANPDRSVAVFDLMVDGRCISRHFLFFATAKSLELPDPDIKATLSADGHHLTVSARHFAREVWITFGKYHAMLSDDAFDLLPGESRTLTLTSTADADALRTAMHVQSLYGSTRRSARMATP